MASPGCLMARSPQAVQADVSLRKLHRSSNGWQLDMTLDPPPAPTVLYPCPETFTYICRRQRGIWERQTAREATRCDSPSGSKGRDNLSKLCGGDD